MIGLWTKESIYREQPIIIFRKQVILEAMNKDGGLIAWLVDSRLVCQSLMHHSRMHHTRRCFMIGWMYRCTPCHHVTYHNDMMIVGFLE